MTSIRNICINTIAGSVAVRAVGIASGPASRREREASAVMRLVEAAFGPAAELRHEPCGRPYVYVGPDRCFRSISISHCADTAMLAVAPEGMAVGIDCEHYRTSLRNVATRFLAPGELPLWAASDALLLRAWTIKEAVYKAAETPGLALADIALPHPAERPGVARAAGGRFRLVMLPGLAPAATIALAVSGSRGPGG